ncbi:MAG: hypothetical protein B6D55_06870 [Candidatus Omnitrophica bacterium 4484_70.2]|nr:MAG: hypothetical protein B6D55_06870 [Candidatus Omnitrophica bacterium 4484_70.2]
MPFGMGPAGWLILPQIYPYLTNLYQTWPVWGNPYYFGWGFADELAYLKQLKQNLEAQLQAINQRIEELEE